MDANETRFHHFLGEENWKPIVDLANAPDPDAPIADWVSETADVTLHELVFRFPRTPGEASPEAEDRRGADCDRFGNWYWIDESETEIRFLGVDRTQAQHFWSAADLADCQQPVPEGSFGPKNPPDPPDSLSMRGLAVTEHHYLVVGLLDPAGLLIFDLHAGGPPLQMLWPIPFTPFDIAPAPGGGVWILDRPDDDFARYWALDRRFRVIMEDQATSDLAEKKDDFQPKEGEAVRLSPGRSFPTGITLAMASPLETLHAVAIESLPDGTVLILESDPNLAYSVIYRYRFGQQIGQPLSLNDILRGMLTSEARAARPDATVLQGHDFAFVPETSEGPVNGLLYIVASDGNQSFKFVYGDLTTAENFRPAPDYLPMRRFSGKALVACQGQVYYDLDERWLPLAPQLRRRYRNQAVLELPVRDGKQPDTVWHRLLLDAHIPPGSEVHVESRVANHEDLVGQMPWATEPRLYKRVQGTEIPNYNPFTGKELARDGVGTWELLFQNARGRYLQLRLTLKGNGRHSPRLRALRTYYPRFSYLHDYLPAAYRSDINSAHFMDRFLANFEGIYTTLEDRITQAQWLFDADTTTADYLEWLALWLGVTLDPAWDEGRRRLFLRHALTLFGQRGTLSGLIRTIRLAIDPRPDDSLFDENVLAINTGLGGTANQIACQTVRIIEQYTTRHVSPIIYGDPAAEGPRAIVADKWAPTEGAESLHALYQDYLIDIYPLKLEDKTQLLDLDALNAAWNTNYEMVQNIQFSPIVPANTVQAADWRGFVDGPLGFTYAEVTVADAPLYRLFLARRYQHVATLNDAYELSDDDAHTSFEKIPIPAENDFPGQDDRLKDWAQFVSLVVPIHRYAHRFTVLVAEDPTGDSETTRQRLEYVRRIVELAKPAHAAFEVRSFLALFQVGSARVGLDTLLGQGSRFVALMLGSGYLAESYLGATHPWDVTERSIVGRDALEIQV